MLAALQDNMSAPPPVPAIGSSHGGVLGLHKMFATGSAMPAPAKDPYLIDKI